jgi:hypothetical protein
MTVNPKMPGLRKPPHRPFLSAPWLHRFAVINLRNDDPTAEEFDSTALTIEKVIAGGRSGVIRLRPLEPGRYPFVGEYHAETAQGVVIVD